MDLKGKRTRARFYVKSKSGRGGVLWKKMATSSSADAGGSGVGARVGGGGAAAGGVAGAAGAAGTGMEAGDDRATQTLDLNTLTYPQLAQLKKQLDEELTHLTTSYQQLRAAQSKFRDCLGAIGGAGLGAGSGPITKDVRTGGVVTGDGDGDGAGEKGKVEGGVNEKESKRVESAGGGARAPPSSSPSSPPAQAPPTKPSSILVPLTTSLYVPGTLDPNGALLVDIGTGFFVSKTAAEAADFYTRKVDELAGNLAKLDGLVQGKGRMVRVVEDGMFFFFLFFYIYKGGLLVMAFFHICIRS